MNIKKEKTYEMFRKLYAITWNICDGMLDPECMIETIKAIIEQNICYTPIILRSRMNAFLEKFERLES